VKTTAEKFRQKPHDVYEQASQGEVVIKHDRYRKIDFILTSRPRMSVRSLDKDFDHIFKGNYEE